MVGGKNMYSPLIPFSGVCLDRGRLVTLQLVRAHGKCPRSGPNLLVLLALPVQRCSGPRSRGSPWFPPLEGMKGGCRPLPCAVHRVRYPITGYPFPGKKCLYLPWIGPHAREYPAASTSSARKLKTTRWRKVSRYLCFRWRWHLRHEERDWRWTASR